ncbi:MAG: YicC/YloC family endoribonuclease [Pseudomonadota bacterium]|nr:YicC/YloC family endoribonuclease [Pseudomonadota bacterium]
MTSSMTAFARAEAQPAEGMLVWELRTVNHRYLDINLRLPEELRFLEPRCRELIQSRLGRGRCDGFLKFERARTEPQALDLNHETARALADLLGELATLFPEAHEPRLSEILAWPGMLAERSVDREQLGETAMQALNEALGELVATRHREGVKLGQMIEKRIDASRAEVKTLRGQLPAINQALRERWQNRLAEMEGELDPARLHQEIALLLNKSDASEEIDRLEAHLDEVQRVLRSGKAIGRRLDFLMQELNREANTLGSKSVDTHSTAASVELKVLIDQMREQVQNIE